MSRIGHLDIRVTNIRRALKFYQRLLGIEFYQVGPRYFRADFDSAPGLGLDEVEKIATGQTICPYIFVPSVDESASQVEALGGKLVNKKWELPNGNGFVIRIKDSEGNIIGLYSK